MQEKIVNRSHVHRTSGGLVLLLAMIACALPAQTIQPTAGIDPNAIGTSIAGTLEASAKQTEQANPAPVTATPFPTEVLSSPEVISSYETSLVKLEDGSTQLKDYRAGLQIIFPPNWMPIRVGEPEYYEASEKVGTQNPWFLEEIGWIQTLDVNVFRVNAYDTHPEHLFYGTLPKINVVFQQGDTRTLMQVEADEKRLIENSVQAEHKFLSSDFQTTSDSVNILIFQAQWKAQTFDRTHYIGTFFKVPTGLVIIDFYIPSDYKEAVVPEYDQIIGSITLFNP